MIEIPRILCPIDFSATSRHALEHAVAVAKWYESEIVALHVVHEPIVPQPPVIGVAFAETGATSMVDYQTRINDLREWLEPARQAGLKTEAIVDRGVPVERILDRAETASAGLIAMGTHGHGGIERFILGSVAEKVLRKAKCPVMTVPPTSVTTAKVPYTRLLCPVDFSECSIEALAFACSLAEEGDAHLTVLHVLDWPRDDELLVERLSGREFSEVVEGRARERLETLISADARVWSKPETKIRYGKPYREIVDVAQRESSDVIVMGVRGRGPIDLAMFGSTTNQVVRAASCPVVTVKQ